MKKLFVIEDNSYTSDWAFGEMADPINNGGWPKCPSCGLTIGLRDWLPPFRIKLSKGVKTNKPGDLIYGEFYDFMVSERFREVWEKAKLKGIIEWRPVEIVGPRAVLFKYFYPLYRPATAIPDFNRMIVVWAKEPPKCEVCYSAGIDAKKGIYLKEDSIPDDDLFKYRGGVNVLTSQNFKDISEEAALSNIELIPAE